MQFLYLYVESCRTKFLAKLKCTCYIFLMIKTKKQLYYVGDIQKLKQKLNIFVIELYRNKDIAIFLNNKYNVIWYVTKTDEGEKSNRNFFKIADIAKGEIYINKNICMEEIIYRLLNISDVVVVGRVSKIKEALDIIDEALSKGKEVVCLKNSGYLADKLINDGAKGV